MKLQAQDCTESPPETDDYRKAWWLCLSCALFGLMLFVMPSRLPFVPVGITSSQIGIWLCLGLLLGLWLLRTISALFGVLLVFLVMGVLGLASITTVLKGAGNDAFLWWLGALCMSVAARESGLLGWLLSRALQPWQSTPALLKPIPSVVWLGLAFSLLPSPRHAAQWCQIVRQFLLPIGPHGRELVAAAQLCAWLAWMPAHWANLLVLALLPADALDRFAPLFWWQQTWPMLALAVALGIYNQWKAQNTGAPGNVTQTAVPTTQDAGALPPRPAARTVAGVALACVMATMLQVWHGIGPGLISVFAIVALFALHCITPSRLQSATDWPLLVIASVLPSLITLFGQSLPNFAFITGQYSVIASRVPGIWLFSSLLLPALLCLRTLIPGRALLLLSLVLLMAWSVQYERDMLKSAIPVLIAIHWAEFLHRTQTSGHSGWQGLKSAFLRPQAWLAYTAYFLWIKWYGWQ